MKNNKLGSGNGGRSGHDRLETEARGSSKRRWGEGSRVDDAEQARQLILSAAIGCYEQQGIAATTIEQVAQAAQVSRRTVYRYFPSREAIIRAVVEEQASEFFAGMAASLPDVNLAFSQLLEHCVLYALEHGPHVAGHELLLSRVNVSTTANYYLASGQLAQQWQDILHPAFLRAQARGEIAAEVELPILVALIGRLVMSWIQFPEPRQHIRKQLKVLFNLV